MLCHAPCYSIKNTFNPAGSGTAIQVDDDYESLARIHISSSPPRNTNNDTHTHAPSPSLTPRGIGATACTLKTDVYVINVHSNRKSVSHGFLAKIFQALDRHGIAVDMISTSEVHVSLVVGRCGVQLLRTPSG